MIDLHLHTKISFDSDETEENYIRQAIKLGDKVLGFSEHYDYDVLLNGGDQPLADVDKILHSPKFIEGVEVLRGLEIGYSKPAIDRYREVYSEPFDYFICSVHTVGGRGDCYYPRFYNGLSRREAYETYFNAVYECVKSNLEFQILGHLGYVSRYAPYPDRQIIYTEFANIIDNILRCIIDRGASLEINSSVGDMPCLSLPDRDVIVRYLELGGKNLTFGSDAHMSKNYKRGEDRIKAFLQSIGVKKLCYYRDKKIEYYGI
jgi:histidinol-phosphatase (PHP family)